MEKNEFKNIIEKYDKIVFFGGAGVSTESNIPDFRGTGGLTSLQLDYSFEEILSNYFLYNNTKLFYDFYKKYMIYPYALPNSAHKKLSELEKQGKLISVITQNIDGLHQKAGSKCVHELHGSVYRNYCTECKKSFDLDYIFKQEDIPYCDVCGSLVRPDVVLYGEALNNNVIEASINDIQKSKVLIVGGTSLNVYPAAGLLRYFNGDRLILINKESTEYDRYADLIIREPIGKFFSETI